MTVRPSAAGKHRSLRHAGDARSGHRVHRSVLRHAHPLVDLHHRRNRHQGALHPRSARHRPAGREIPHLSTGLADPAFFGPEAEFFIFDNVQYDSKSNGTFYSVDSEEGIWNTGRDEMPNLGYKIRHKEGYFPVAPADTQQDIRTEMCC